MKRLILVLLVVAIAATSMLVAGCTEADRVSSNVSRDADSFNVMRRLAVTNVRSDKPIFECIGRFSKKDTEDNQLEIVVEVGPGRYKKHFVQKNSWTTYVVEDISGAYVDKYHYEVHYLPEMFQPIKIVNK